MSIYNTCKNLDCSRKNIIPQAQMLACKGIFALWFNVAGGVKRIGGNAAKTCEARLPQKHYTIRQPQFQQTVQNQEQTQKSLSRKTGEGLIILFKNYSRTENYSASAILAFSFSIMSLAQLGIMEPGP